jgi:hypothetical protein
MLIVKMLKTSKWPVLILGLCVIGLAILVAPKVWAANFPPEQSSGSIGLQGTIASPPPKQAATIATPVNGASFNNIPITINGLCPSGLLIKIFSNNVFVGSEQCDHGSYSIQIDLFAGQNDLVARDYDALDQAGPDSNTVTVTFNDALTAQFGSRVSLTSPYAKRGVDPGSTLSWPIIISGGNGPYAVSVDWGDGAPTTLLSQPFTGTINITHIYKTAGVYTIIVKATDVNGTEAFLQLVGVANGAVQSSASAKSGGNTAPPQAEWWPALAMIPLILAAFWVGQRHELFTIRRQLEKSRGRDR